MMRRRKDRQRDLPANAEINVTSLIDVAFTLLVIFIITAPALQAGLEVQLPEAQTRSVTARDNPFVVTVTADGTIFIAETEVTEEEFASAAPRLIEAANARDIYLRGDREARYGVFLRIFAALQRVTEEQGGSVWLINEPEPRR